MALSRPLGYGLLAVLAIAAYAWSSEDSAKAGKSAAKKPFVARSKGQDWDFPATNVALFDKPKNSLRDVFKPGIYIDKSTPQVPTEELMKIPSKLAGGEGDWAYTGMAAINGVNMALLENASSHQGGYVKEGETWKKSRIVSITTSCLVLAGSDGSEETVYRFNANQTPKPKPLADAGFHPVDLGSALKGPIGADLQITKIQPAPKNGAPSPATKIGTP